MLLQVPAAKRRWPAVPNRSTATALQLWELQVTRLFQFKEAKSELGKSGDHTKWKSYCDFNKLPGMHAHDHKKHNGKCVEVNYSKEYASNGK